MNLEPDHSSSSLLEIRSRTLTLICAFSVATVGLVELVKVIGRSAEPISWAKTFAILQTPDTHYAFVLLLSAAALVAAQSGRKILTWTCGGLICAIGAGWFTTLLVGRSYTPYPIDSVLWEDLQNKAAPALAGSGLFLWAGIAFLLLPFKGGTAVLRPFLASTLGAVLSAFGAVALLGYPVGLESAMGWGQLTSFSLPLAFAALLLGTGILAAALQQAQSEARRKWWVPLSCCLAVSAFTLLFWRAEVQQEKRLFDQSTVVAAFNVRDTISERVDGLSHLLNRFAARWRLDLPPPSATAQATDAWLVMDHVLSLKMVKAIAPDSKTLMLALSPVLPPSPELLRATDRLIPIVLARANRLRTTVFTAPFEMDETGNAMLMAAPFPDRKKGGVVGLVSLPALFRLQPLLTSQGPYSFMLIDEHGHEYGEPAKGRRGQDWSRSLTGGYHGFTWHVVATPTEALCRRIPSNLSDLIPFVGLLFSLLLGLLIHLAQSANTQAKKWRGASRALQKLTSALEQAADGILITDRQGVIEYANSGFEKMSGYPREQVVGQTPKFLKSGQHPTDFYGHMWSDLLNGKTFQGVVTNRRQDGSLYCVDKTITPIRDRRGQITHFVSADKDITERRRAEEARLRLAAIVESSDDAIIGLDDHGTVQSWNCGAARMYGYESWEILGHSIEMLMSRAEADELRRLCGEPSSDEPPGTLEQRHLTRDCRTLEVSLTVSVVRGIAGERLGMSVIARDTTEKKRTERELKRKSEALARSNAELEQFAYIASHDMQEPLRMVHSYLRLLDRKYRGKLDQTADDYIAFAMDGAARMRQMIQDLLTYSRVSTHLAKPATVRMKDVVDTALRDLSASIVESGAKVTVDSLPSVVGGSSQLVQLFQNLISNAIKYRGEKPLEIHIFSAPREDAWVFSVHDNGIGIHPDFHGCIFDIFRRLHSHGTAAGTGIGLAICKKIVERHGGEIWVESGEGNGATFSFQLPLSRIVREAEPPLQDANLLTNSPARATLSS